MIILYFLIATGIAVQGTIQSSITFPETSDKESLRQQMQSDEPPNFDIKKQMSYDVTSIGLKSLRELLTPHNNAIVSPYNIYTCLGLLSLGAAGDTKNEIRSILWPHNESLTAKDIIIHASGVSQASGLFLVENDVPKEDFIKSALQYGGHVKNVDFSNVEKATNLINKWVSDNTNGTITNLLQSGNLNANTRMVVVSALLFNGKWLQSFIEPTITMDKFEVEIGKSVNAKFIQAVATVPVVHRPLFDAIGIPYKEEGMMMYCILPKMHGFEALKKLLSLFSVHFLKKLKEDFESEETIIILPQLKINGRFSLAEFLKKQGVSSMFDPSEADFSEVTDNSSGLFVSDIIHCVHFEMNEQGTLASASTAAIASKSVKFTFKANRPFIFLIADKNDIVLFIGAITHPE